jgi:hypothetical protein
MNGFLVHFTRPLTVFSATSSCLNNSPLLLYSQINLPKAIMKDKITVRCLSIRCDFYSYFSVNGQ